MFKLTTTDGNNGAFILVGAPGTLRSYLPVAWYFYLSYLDKTSCCWKPLPTKLSNTPGKEALTKGLRKSEVCFQFTAEESAAHHHQVDQGHIESLAEPLTMSLF